MITEETMEATKQNNATPMGPNVKPNITMDASPNKKQTMRKRTKKETGHALRAAMGPHEEPTELIAKEKQWNT